jgi:polyhydroxyalkanoate synthesis repressor PhaR
LPLFGPPTVLDTSKTRRDNPIGALRHELELLPALGASMSEIQTEVSKEPRIIKRYSNRKLYDTVSSKYVRLEDIAVMVKAGSEVRVVDNQSKEDLTSVTLAQIIFEDEKAKRNPMPLGMLRDLVRHGGESLSEFINKEVSPRVQTIREEAEGIRDRLLRRDGEGKETKPIGKDVAKELVSTSQRAFEDLQRRVDERVRAGMDSLQGNLPVLTRDVEALEQRIASLEAKLSEIEKG